MKKVTKLIVITLAVIMVIVSAAGCKKEKKPALDVEPYSINISALGNVANNNGKIGPNGGFMNAKPLLKQWDVFPIYFPPFPEDMNWIAYNRIRIRATYYWDDMEEHDQRNSMVMVSFIYDPEGDWAGPPEGPGPNTPMKQFNVTNGEDFDGWFGGISSEKGAFLFLEKAPAIVLLQNASPDVEWIELLEITFFRFVDED